MKFARLESAMEKLRPRREESEGTHTRKERERHDAPLFIVAIIAPTGAIYSRDKREREREKNSERF